MLCYGICSLTVFNCSLTVFNFSLTVFITAAQRREERKLEEKLLDAAREGDGTTLSQLVSQGAEQYCLHFRCV